MYLTTKAINTSSVSQTISQTNTATELIKLDFLSARTQGSRQIKIGVIDGPVNTSHAGLAQADIRTVSSTSPPTCSIHVSSACRHGTFVTGMLCATAQSGVRALCPGCPILARPIFCETSNAMQQCPNVTADDLASAIVETIQAGANVINLSVGLPINFLKSNASLQNAFDFAAQNQVLLIAAAGNQARVGHLALFAHPWVLPVVACDNNGQLWPQSNIGASIGARGLMAPGVNILSIAPSGGLMHMTGTSVAAPFVTAVVALLWSLFPKANGQQIRQSLLHSNINRKSVIPPYLNAMQSAYYLQNRLS